MQSAKCCHASTPWTTSSFRYSTLGNHWVTATNMFSRRPNTVYWCDSLHGTVSVLSMVQLTSLLRHHTDRPHHSSTSLVASAGNVCAATTQSTAALTQQAARKTRRRWSTSSTTISTPGASIKYHPQYKCQLWTSTSRCIWHQPSCR